MYKRNQSSSKLDSRSDILPVFAAILTVTAGTTIGPEHEPLCPTFPMASIALLLLRLISAGLKIPAASKMFIRFPTHKKHRGGEHTDISSLPLLAYVQTLPQSKGWLHTFTLIHYHCAKNTCTLGLGLQLRWAVSAGPTPRIQDLYQGIRVNWLLSLVL